MSVEADERRRLIAQMFAQYPPAGPDSDAKLRVRVYAEETSDIPVEWLRVALRWMRDQTERHFHPSVSEIRFAAARMIRFARWHALGRDTSQITSNNKLVIHRELQWAHAVAPTPKMAAEIAMAHRKDEELVLAMEASADVIPIDHTLREAFEAIRSRRRKAQS